VRSLSGLVGHNWTLKVSALGIALLLWVAVRVDAPNRHDLTSVPVRVDLQDPQWALLDDPSPASVTVRISGPSGEIIRIVGERPAVVIPLDDVHSADTTVMLRTQWLRVQDRAGVVVEGIQPAAVRLTLEPVERLSLPPAPRLEGSFPGRLALAEAPIVEPSELRVIGARSRVMNLDSIPLLPVDLGTISGSGGVTVAVDTLGLQGIHVQPPTVQVQLQVQERIERIVSGLPVVLPENLRGIAGDLEIVPATGSVILRGARSVVERTDPRELRLVVQVEEEDLPEAGEEGAFTVRLSGLPSLLEADIQQTEVVLRRVEESP
jgi:YbbR domain-containing protein